MNMSKLNPTLAPVTLQYIQSQLLSIDEKCGYTTPNNSVKRYNTSGPYAMPATSNTKYKPRKSSPTKSRIKCGYKPCGKLGHTTEQCNKKKRDEAYKNRNNKTSDNKRSNTTKENVQCHKCKGIGHYANECKKDSSPQQALRASVDTKISHSATESSTNMKEMIMMATSDAPTRWNTRPHRPPFVKITGFQDFLPDSGATSHFVSSLDDLENPQPCDMKVTIADGSKVQATHVGQTEIEFTTDNGTPSTLILANVYYIPGLSRRLFSLQSFTRDTPFSVEINHHYTRLHFGDGETYTWPIKRNNNTTDRYTFMAMESEDSTNQSTKQITTLPTRPIPLEKGMTRLGFRAAKGLLTGTLHRVWDDCHIQASPDPYCWSAKLAISRTAPRNLRRPVY
jgi:hypothetical protein